MANTDNAIGLSPVRSGSGAPWNGATEIFCVPATDNTITYIGAPIKLAGDADANGVPTATTATASGDALVGVCVSVLPNVATDPPYRAASTLRYINVCTDPDALYEVQVTGTALTTTMIGNVCDMATPTTGTAATGRSLVEANLSTVSASGDGTEDFTIVRLAPRPDNEVGADAKVWVRLNNFEYIDANAGN
jgi:hypothetical protein